MKHLSPPAVAKNGNYQGMVFMVSFQEFNPISSGILVKRIYSGGGVKNDPPPLQKWPKMIISA